MHDHILLQLAIILAAAKIGGEICERVLKQPAVLGEIVLGVLVGGSVLGWIDGGSPILAQIAEIGAVLLLFEVGLESDIEDLTKVGGAAISVACVGVIVPFVLGYFVAHALGQTPITSIFVGASLTATSVGITARVFSDLNALHTREARIVLGAAVADDVIGLIILAAVSGLAITKIVSVVEISKLTLFATLFLLGALIIGLKSTPILLHWVKKMQTRAAMSAVAIIFCFLVATCAGLVHLAPIVGAFAAGLVLAKAEHRVHFEEKVKSIADIFIPVFFVMMGAQMSLHMFNLATAQGRATVALGSALLAVAIIGKVVAGLAVPAKSTNRLTVGIGMIPRGEVGLIFASIGLQTKIINDGLYAAIIFVVICTTFVTPPLLKRMASRKEREGGMNEAPGADAPMMMQAEAITKASCEYS